MLFLAWQTITHPVWAVSWSQQVRSDSETLVQQLHSFCFPDFCETIIHLNINQFYSITARLQREHTAWHHFVFMHHWRWAQVVNTTAAFKVNKSFTDAFLTTSKTLIRTFLGCVCLSSSIVTPAPSLCRHTCDDTDHAVFVTSPASVALMGKWSRILFWHLLSAVDRHNHRVQQGWCGFVCFPHTEPFGWLQRWGEVIRLTGFDLDHLHQFTRTKTYKLGFKPSVLDLHLFAGLTSDLFCKSLSTYRVGSSL